MDKWYTGISWQRHGRSDYKYVFFVAACSIIQDIIIILTLGRRELTLRPWALFYRPAEWFDNG